MAFISLLALFLFSISIFYLFLKRSKARYTLPPGPSGLPLIGNLHQLGACTHRSLDRLSQKYGPLMYLRLGTHPTIIASSPRIAKEFLKTHDSNCCNKPLITPFSKYSYNFSDFAFTPYGEQWRELRKICIIQIFSTKRVSLFRSLREEEVERMIRSINSKMVDGSDKLVNLREESVFLSNNVALRTALGKTYCSSDSSDKGRLAEILEETMALIGGFFFKDYVPVLGWIDVVTGMMGRMEKNFRQMDEFYQQVIEEHRDPMRRKGDRDLNEDAVDALLDIQATDAKLTDQHIKGVVMDIFNAGTDTSATMIEWAMIELMRNPEAMRKVQDEVRAHVGSKGKVEDRDLNQLNYLKFVVKETLRLHPPVTLIPRETLRHFKVDGYDIPAKSRLFVNTWAIGRNPDVWERPEDFDPERFKDSSVSFTGHDFELLAFGTGRRICPGMRSGIAVVELALANLLYCFNWELPPGMSIEDISTEEVPGLIVHPKSSLRLVATKY